MYSLPKKQSWASSMSWKAKSPRNWGRRSRRIDAELPYPHGNIRIPIIHQIARIREPFLLLVELLANVQDLGALVLVLGHFDDDLLGVGLAVEIAANFEPDRLGARLVPRVGRGTEEHLVSVVDVGFGF